MHIPFLCVVIVALIPFLAKLTMTVALTREGNYDNRHPRDQQATLTGWKKRAIAAQLNGFEAFPIFAAFVLMNEMMRPSGAWVAPLCVTFVILRFAYTALYLADQASLRSIVWFTSFAVLFTLALLPLF